MEFLVMRRSIFLMVLEYDDAQTTPLKYFCKETRQELKAYSWALSRRNFRRLWAI